MSLAKDRSASLRILALSFVLFLLPLATSRWGILTAAADPVETTKHAFIPPEGEQPTYGKKFRPNLPVSNFIFELNPTLLLRRGIGVQGEMQVGDMFSLGLDVDYYGANVDYSRGVKTWVSYFGVAPKFRFYPLQALAGFFVGAKVYLGTYWAEIDDTRSIITNTIKMPNRFTVSPTIHVGYRFTSFSGFTMAIYLGGGFNIPAPTFQEADLPTGSQGDGAIENARDKANAGSYLGVFHPDFGITLGFAL